MVYKYNFSISGDMFYPEKILDKIQGNFTIDSFFNPNDKITPNSNKEYGYGGISFYHPKKYTVDFIKEYEEAFVEFIEINSKLFFDFGIEEMQIFIEIYYDGGQCNFEVFDKKMLSKLSFFEVSLPVSVYILEENEPQKWENEINREWIKEKQD